MSRSVRTTAVVIAWLLLCSIPAAGQQPPDDREAVLAVVRQLFDGMRARDAEAVRALFHPSAQLFSSTVRDGKPLVSVVPIERFISSIGRPGPEVNDERTRNEQVQVDGTLASVWAEYGFYRGKTFSHCGVDSFQLAKDADGWKIISVADTRRTGDCEGWPQQADHLPWSVVRGPWPVVRSRVVAGGPGRTWGSKP